MVAVGWLLHISEYIIAVVLIEKVTKCGQVLGVAGRCLKRAVSHSQFNLKKKSVDQRMVWKLS